MIMAFSHGVTVSTAPLCYSVGCRPKLRNLLFAEFCHALLRAPFVLARAIRSLLEALYLLHE